MHYHPAREKDVDYSIAFKTFHWALSRCAVLMMDDHKVRHAHKCYGAYGKGGCMENVNDEYFQVRNLQGDSNVG